MKDKEERLEMLRKNTELPLLEYGLYVEINQKYHGYFKYTNGKSIFISNGVSNNVCHDPKWHIVYYDNPIDKNIVYDLRNHE